MRRVTTIRGLATIALILFVIWLAATGYLLVQIYGSVRCQQAIAQRTNIAQGLLNTGESSEAILALLSAQQLAAVMVNKNRSASFNASDWVTPRLLYYTLEVEKYCGKHADRGDSIFPK